MAGKSVDKYVVMAQGKMDGKTVVWIAATFNSVKEARPWVGFLNLARTAGDTTAIAKMDVHQPGIEEGKAATGVKYSGKTVQYAPEVQALDDDITLGE